MCNPIDVDDYNYYIGELKRSKRNRLELARRIEENRKREDARLEELRKQQEKEAEEKVRIEQANKDKLDNLKKLIDEHPELSEDRGVLICKDILKRGVKYENMSDRQKWRIDKALDMLSALNKDVVKEETTYNFDDTESEKIEVKESENIKGESTLEKIFDGGSIVESNKCGSLASMFSVNDDEEIDYSDKTLEDLFEPVTYDEVQKDDMDKEIRKMIDTLLNKVSLKTEKDGDIRFAYKVSMTVNRIGKISDKQRTFLEKGYKKLTERKE